MSKCAHRTLSEKVMREAERHLSQSDEVMARLVSDHGACPLSEREFRPFHTLATAIISQQLSAKAADTIKRRVSQITPSPFPCCWLADRQTTPRDERARGQL